MRRWHPFFGTGTTGAAAKRLQRHWIGIERNPEYVAIAQVRIQAVGPADIGDVIQSRRSLPRIPFSTLVACGLLQPGQCLYLGKKGTHTAVVLADGLIRHDSLTGSIHLVARTILQASMQWLDSVVLRRW